MSDRERGTGHPSGGAPTGGSERGTGCPSGMAPTGGSERGAGRRLGGLDDRGAGGIAVLAAAAVLGSVGLLAVATTQALTVRHEVAAAADLAALAGAGVLTATPGTLPAGGEQACAAAARIAAANSARLVGCEARGAVLDVVVERQARFLGAAAAVRARARAGPAIPVETGGRARQPVVVE